MKEINQPNWLNYRRCIWINLCDQCKNIIISNEVVEDKINKIVCSKCKYIFIKYGHKYHTIRGSPKRKCLCGRYFLPKLGSRQTLCKRCREDNKDGNN